MSLFFILWQTLVLYYRNLFRYGFAKKFQSLYILWILDENSA